MTPEDRKLIEAYLSGEGNSIDQAYNAERAREAVKRLLEEFDDKSTYLIEALAECYK